MLKKKQIVVVEDEPDILEVLVHNLRREGYCVESSMDGTNGLELIRHSVPDLVLLDLMLPGMDGLDICRELNANAETRHIPIIMVSAKGEESDVVLGLGIGADDYVTKPFSPRELIARVKAILRRGTLYPTLVQAKILEIGGLKIDVSKHMIYLNGKQLVFTATEFRLLHHLASNPGRVFTRDQLMAKSLGTNSIVIDRNIDVHIRAIRKKLDCTQQFIETIRGIGYRFVDSIKTHRTHLETPGKTQH